MDLILWRHAQAELHPDPDGGLPGDKADMARRLTSRGEKQAARMGAWLDRQLPSGAVILCSPAVRAEQTAQALDRKIKNQRPRWRPTGHRANCWRLPSGQQASKRWCWWGINPPWAAWWPVCWVCLSRSAASRRVRCGGCGAASATGSSQTLVVTVQTPELL